MPKKSELVWKFEYDIKKRSYAKRVILAIDQLLNVIVWNGSQDETISSNVGRRIEAGKAYKVEKWLCTLLSKIQEKHCEKALGE